MTLTAYRLALKRYGRSGAFSGEGARRAGGRWNSPGIAVVYASETLSLAAMEFLVHFDTTMDVPELICFRLEFDEKLVTDVGRLPEDWRQIPAVVSTQTAGDKWFRQKDSVVVRVPSAVIPGEHNYVINPTHPDFRKIRIGRARAFNIDPRLV